MMERDRIRQLEAKIEVLETKAAENAKFGTTAINVGLQHIFWSTSDSGAPVGGAS